MSIEELKLALAKARIENENAKMHAADLWGDVEETEAHKKYKTAEMEFEQSKLTLIDADRDLREEVLEEYNHQSLVDIGPGLRIKMHHKIKYALGEITAWAKVNALHLFKFDEAMFKKNPPDGAPFTKYDEPYVEVATDSEDFGFSPEVMRENGIPWTDPMSGG